ncbi:MAG: glycosyltransferase family 4 protein, partial [Myxococcales bacterium]|nr:glycosyltransferase family 4 protein [Myxococcales bacterium]
DLAQLHVDDKYDPARMFYFRRVLLPALRRMTRLVAVSEATKRDLETVIPSSGPPITVIPNGVDYERFERKEDGREGIARKATGLTGNFLLYASRLEHPGKNHLRLVRAFARSQARHDHILALAGKDWGAEGMLREEAERLQVADRIKFLGFVPDEILPGLVAAASAVIMVGLHEGFGLPALEALAAGRPVCASTTGALPEVVGPHAVLCDPFDEASIEKALDQILGNDALREKIMRAGPIWAKERSWDRTAEGLLRECQAAVP